MKNQLHLLSVIFLLFSCGGENSASSMNDMKFSRIVSLSPSITAQILDLESSHLLAGVTTYSPPLPHDVEIVGSLTNPNVEKIILLKPDALLYSIEDAAVQRTEQLTALGIKLFPFRKNTDFSTICENYRTLARIIGKEELAEKKLALYNRKLEEIKIKSENLKKPSVAFFVSQEPLITVSGESFISGIINDAGGDNSYSSMEKAYPLVSLESLVILKPDIIISMMPDAELFFRKMLSAYKMERSDLYENIYSIDPDCISLYTPENYLLSAEKLHNIISLHNKKKKGE